MAAKRRISKNTQPKWLKLWKSKWLENRNLVWRYIITSRLRKHYKMLKKLSSWIQNCSQN